MNPSIQTYIGKARAQGLADEQIKANLLEAGWDSAVVNSHFGSNEDNPVPVPESHKKTPIKRKKLVMIAGFVLLLVTLGYLFLATGGDAQEMYKPITCSISGGRWEFSSSCNPSSDDPTELTVCPAALPSPDCKCSEDKTFDGVFCTNTDIEIPETDQPSNDPTYFCRTNSDCTYYGTDTCCEYKPINTLSYATVEDKKHVCEVGCEEACYVGCEEPMPMCENNTCILKYESLTTTITPISNQNTNQSTKSEFFDLYGLSFSIGTDWDIAETNRQPEPTSPGSPILGHDCATYAATNPDTGRVLGIRPTCGFEESFGEELPTNAVVIYEGSNKNIVRVETPGWIMYGTSSEAEISSLEGTRKESYFNPYIELQSSKHDFLHGVATITLDGSSQIQESELKKFDDVVISVLKTK